MTGRCGGLELEKSRKVTPPYGLRDPKSTTGWGRGGQPFGLTLRQVEAILLKREPGCAPKNTNWKPILLQAKQIVESYDTKATLRQLFYQLVARQIIENDQRKYKYLSRKTAEARRDGWFPDLIDQTSEILVGQHFTSPDEAKDYLRSIYRRDHSEGQEVTIYLAVEKAGIQTQLWSWFSNLGFPILALGGYGSQSYKDQIKANVASHVYFEGERETYWNKGEPHRPAVLIYAGDHDASGDDLFRDLVQRTDPGAVLSDDYTTATHTRLWKALHRIALTKEQAADLPQNPGKDDDTRNEAFMNATTTRTTFRWSWTRCRRMCFADPTKG